MNDLTKHRSEVGEFNYKYSLKCAIRSTRVQTVDKEQKKHNCNTSKLLKYINNG